ncbi:MAG: hypothetical protein J0I80_02850 [Sphingomonas sp.]|nr:hypothetical protein [Sphingomonas sp.]
MIRRDVLKLGGAATAGLALATPLAAAVDQGRRPGGTVLIDDRFADARTFAAAARDAGVRVLSTGGDVPSLRYGLLRGEPLEGLGGLTTYADMMVIASLAAEARRAFSLRIAHEVGQGKVTHRLLDGPSGCIAVLDAAGWHWPAGVWTLMATAPAKAVATVSARHRTHNGGRDGALWSWAIA